MGTSVVTLKNDVYSASLAPVAEMGTLLVSVSLNESDIFTTDFSACEQPYLFLDGHGARQDVLILHFGCTEGEDDRRIVGEVMLLHIETRGPRIIWSASEATRVLHDECWDESYIEFVDTSDLEISVIRVTRKHDSDPVYTERTCPEVFRAERVERVISLEPSNPIPTNPSPGYYP